MRSKTKIFAGAAVVSAFAALALGVASGTMNQGDGLLNAEAGTCSHKGYHYDENLATATGTGNAEFYACCTCHETWLAAEKPTGEFADRSIDQAEGLVKNDYKYYYVVLDAKGGTGGSASINNAVANANLPSIIIPSLTCYSFEGYYTEETGGVQYIDATGAGVKKWDLDNNATLYAHWTLSHTYTSVAEVAATTVSDGVAAHYECSGCHKLFKLVDGNYVETTADELKIAKLASEWNGSLDFNTYCTNGDDSERVSASVVDSKLRFTMNAESHYGEYHSALYYNIKKSDTKKYYMSINGVSYSSGCNVDGDHGYWVKLVIFVINNGGEPVCAGDYYWPDANYKKMDLSKFVMANDDNNVQVIIQCLYGNNGDNKKGEYIDIEDITFTAENAAPATKTFETGTYDIPAMMLGADTTNDLSVSTADGNLTITTSATSTYGNVCPATVWTTSSFENAYFELTVSEITSGSTLYFQLDYIDGVQKEQYLSVFPAAAGTYKVPLASNQCSALTGKHSFRFRFGIQVGNNSSATITSIKLVQLNASWNGDVDFESYVYQGVEERVSASVVDSKLRFTMTGESWFGEYRSGLHYNIKKTEGKKYYMSINGVTYSSGCDLNVSGGYPVSLCIVVVNNGTRNIAGNYYYPDTNYTRMELTDYVMANDDNDVQVIIQCVYGANNSNKKGEYIDIEKITLSVE